jgi:hypothetical protein
MHVVVYLDVVLRVPRGHGRHEVRLGLRRQLQVPFHVFLSTVGGGHTLHAHSNKSTSVQRVHAIHRQTVQYLVGRRDQFVLPAS